jgi:hypothetical protein
VQRLSDQVVDSRLDLLLAPGGIALLQGLTAEAPLTVVDEMEGRMARHHLPDSPV